VIGKNMRYCPTSGKKGFFCPVFLHPGKNIGCGVWGREKPP